MLEVGCGPGGKGDMGVSDIWKLLLQYFSGVLVISALSVELTCLTGVY